LILDHAVHFKVPFLPSTLQIQASSTTTFRTIRAKCTLTAETAFMALETVCTQVLRFILQLKRSFRCRSWQMAVQKRKRERERERENEVRKGGLKQAKTVLTNAL
jgi:hypothetical protein